jgi:hypothetical protein
LLLDRKADGFISFNMAMKRKLPADTNKRAKAIVDLITGEEYRAENRPHKSRRRCYAAGRLNM